VFNAAASCIAPLAAISAIIGAAPTVYFNAAAIATAVFCIIAAAAAVFCAAACLLATSRFCCSIVASCACV